jgi:hypothetical protein
MARRYIRKMACLAKPETTYGVDAAPSGSTDALLLSNVSITPFNAQNVPRDLIRPYFGASEELPGDAFVELAFDVEAVGSGTAGVAPAWGKLLRGCGMAEVIEASTRVDYVPVTDNMESLTIKYFDDGVRHTLLGAMGEITGFSLEQGTIPKFSFRFLGLYSTPAAATPGSVTLTDWKVPQVVKNANSGDITIGGTVASTGAPAISGGTTQASRGLRLSWGNQVGHSALLGDEGIDITDRNITGHMDLALSAADEVTFAGYVESATLLNISLLHGTVAGHKLLVNVPSAQLTNSKQEVNNGRRLIGFDLRAVPVAGNDEIRIVTSF